MGRWGLFQYRPIQVESVTSRQARMLGYLFRAAPCCLLDGDLVHYFDRFLVGRTRIWGVCPPSPPPRGGTHPLGLPIVNLDLFYFGFGWRSRLFLASLVEVG
jgi:hypothetical protein